MENEKYTKEIGKVTYVISSPAHTKETEDALAKRGRNLILQHLKDTRNSPVITPK